MSSLARAATLVGVLSALSLLLGFLRDIVIAAIFGASAEVDAYLVAQGLMNVVLGLVAGALAKSVVPVVAPAAAKGRAAAAHRSVATALSIGIVVIGHGGGRRGGSSASRRRRKSWRLRFVVRCHDPSCSSLRMTMQLEHDVVVRRQ